MKLIIDIDEDIRVAIGQMGLLRIPDEMIRVVDKAIQHGIPLEKIRAEIQKVLNKERDFTSENAKAQAIALNWVLALFDKYAEQDKLMIIEANVNGYTQGLKDAQRQSCKNCKQDPKECGNDAHYGFCQNWEYAEQEPTDEWQNGYNMAWEEAKVFYEKEEPTIPCDLCGFNTGEFCEYLSVCPATGKAVQNDNT